MKTWQRQEAINRVDSLVQLLEEVETAAQLSSDKSSVQGPDGSPASQTVQSAKMVLTTLRNLQTVLSKIDATYIQHAEMAAMLTLVHEHFFSTIRSRYDIHMPLALKFALFFSPVVTESRKQRTTCIFNTFCLTSHSRSVFDTTVERLRTRITSPTSCELPVAYGSGCDLPTLDSLYRARVVKKAQSIMSDPGHPAHELFVMLPSGRQSFEVRF